MKSQRKLSGMPVFIGMLFLLGFLSAAGSEENTGSELLRAEEIIGYQVLDDDRDLLGYVVDLVIRSDGTVPYGVVQFEGKGLEVGVEPGSYLIPLEAGRIDRATKSLILEGVDRTRFGDYPDLLSEDPNALSENAWSGFSDWWSREKGLELDANRDGEYRFREFNGPKFMDGVLVSEILEYGFFCREGNAIGSVEGIMLRVPYPRVVYMALRISEELKNGDALIAVPPGQISIHTERELLSLDFTREKLEELDGFREAWPTEPAPELSD